jgi:TolB-like protein
MRLLAALMLVLVPLAASSAETGAASRPTVAVLYFDYEGKTPDLEVLKKGLTQMLISDLSADESIALVERERLEDVLAELKLGHSGKIDASSAARIGKLLGARVLVMGRFFDLGGTLNISARAVETETGALVCASSAAGKSEAFLELEQSVAKKVREGLRGFASRLDAGHRSTNLRRINAPKRLGTGTAVRFSKALDALDKNQKDVAKQELQAVVKEQPDFELAAMELAALLR